MKNFRSLAALYLIFILFTTSGLQAYEIEEYSPTAPTSFQTKIEVNNETELEKSLRNSPSVQVRNYGGFAQFSTFNLRGADSDDIGVSLEGIRLNSPAQGAYDLSHLSLFGINEIQVIRGGYSPFSTSPSGFINMRLPMNNEKRSSVSWGSYDYFSFGQVLPHASFSFERSDNDFLYSSGATYRRRENNQSLRMNLRSWYRTENYQIWGMLNLVDRELPAPSHDLSAQFEKHFSTIAPMLAFQGNKQGWLWSIWTKFEEQEVERPNELLHNRLWYSGAQLEKIHVIRSDISLRHAIEFTQDYLFHAEFDAKNRHSLALISSAYWTPNHRHLIHPRLRVEFISDLQQPLSAHPGLGGRHEIIENLSVLWNLTNVSRAPSFGELYYSVSGFLPNPDLNREQSIQADIGYEWKNPKHLIDWRQALFAARSFDTIVYKQVSPSEFQSVNSGTQVSLGLENELRSQVFSFLGLSGSYTYLQALIQNVQKPYQPRHHFTATPQVFLHEAIKFSLPIYARSSVRIAKDSDIKLGPQWDIGAKMETHGNSWSLVLEAFNLLRWQLEEVANYPLPQETYFRISAEARF